MRHENTSSGVFWEWQYDGAEAIVSGGSCTWGQSDTGTGTMDWEVDSFDPSDDCDGGPTAGSCNVDAWDPSVPLVSVNCFLTFLNPSLTSVFGVTTPTVWQVGIQPIERFHPGDGGFECECNPIWTSGGAAYKPGYGIVLVYERFYTCPTILGALKGIIVTSPDGLSTLYVPGSGGLITYGSWEITVSGGAGFS